MSSTAMTLWSPGGANTSACSPFKRICSPPAAAAAATSIDAINFNSSAPKAARTATTATIMAKTRPRKRLSSSSSLAVAADPVYRNKNLSIMTFMSTTRSVVSPIAALSLGCLGPNSGFTSMTISLDDGTRKTRRFGEMISCEVILRSNNSRTAPLSSSSSSSSSDSTTATTSNKEEEEGEGETKQLIGARVRVKAPLKVYHVPRVPEVDLTGLEGHLKQYVGLWKGKRISANLPYKVEFVVDIQGRGPVKFLAHLKEDEFEYLD
uniref:Uncharacterized protein MANES_16G040000 n=1 Tax=Rhizophora mucronata TaxID=61149 RepID=A0A2P2IS21_RHIMU